MAIELQGAVTNAFYREVTFVATDENEQVLQEWTQEVEFVNGRAEAVISAAPWAMVRLSAKTDFTLRRRVDCLPDHGLAVADFTGAYQLLGGDLNNDNVIDMKDFTRLRYHWFTENEAADIDGSGGTVMADFSILRENWMQAGDAP